MLLQSRELDPGKEYVLPKIKTGLVLVVWQVAALRWCSKAARKPMIADRVESVLTEILLKGIHSFGATMVIDWIIICWT